MASWLHDKLALVLFKLESTPGVDAVPVVGTDAIYVDDIDIQPNLTEVELKRMRDTFAASGIAIGRAWYNIKIRMPVAGPAAGSPLLEPEISPLVQVCQYALTSSGVPVDTHAYQPSSKATQLTGTLYVYFFQDGGAPELIKSTGVVGTMTKTIAPNAEGFWEFEGQGLYTPPTNPAAPSSPTFDHEDDETVDKGHSLTIDSRTDPINNVKIAMNNEIVTRGDQNQTYGVAGFKVNIGKPTIEVDPELVLTSTYDRHAAVLAETTAAATLQINSLKGARYSWAAGDLQQGAFQYQRDGVMKVAQKLYPRDSPTGNGDDSLILTVNRP